MPARAEPLRPYTIVGDAIPAPLTGTKGDAARGRKIVTTRQLGLCLLCHSGPFPEQRFQGDLAPDLRGHRRPLVRGTIAAAHRRCRQNEPRHDYAADQVVDGLKQVAPQLRGKPLLTAEQIEDVVAFLTTLRE